MTIPSSEPLLAPDELAELDTLIERLKGSDRPPHNLEPVSHELMLKCIKAMAYGLNRYEHPEPYIEVSLLNRGCHTKISHKCNERCPPGAPCLRALR